MNNVKASNAIVSLADMIGSLTADYEGQLVQLRGALDAANKQLARNADETTKARAVMERLNAELGSRRADGRWNVLSLAVLNGWPWPIVQTNLTPSSNGSPGRPPTSPTSEASTRSESSTP